MRVCIIGAGAAGLTAADRLFAQGITDVTVVEAAAEPGGQCLTERYMGRPYDLGAVAIFGSYERTHAVARDLSIGLSELAVATTRIGQPHRVRAPNSPKDDSNWFVRFADAARALGPLNIGAVTEHELHLPMHAWLAARGLEDVPDRIIFVYQSCGYGFLGDDVPALYLIRTLLKCPGTVHRVTEGYRSLWRAYADRCQARLQYNSPVSAIRRVGDTIEIDVPDQVLTVDRLIITAAPVEALRLIDADDEERAVLGAFKPLPYVASLVEADGLPGNANTLVCVRDHQSPGARGHVVSYFRRDADRPIFIAWQCDNGGSDQQIRDILATDLANLGAPDARVIQQRRWPQYFPHLPPEALKAGFLARLEQLQGHRNTYYCGGAYSMELVESAIEDAEHMIGSHFLA